MDFELKGKIALVTGASAGIGRETAILFGKLGANVAITFHSDDAGAQATVEAIKAHGSDAIAVRYDLGSNESIVAAVKAVVDKWGRIDVFVANAICWPPSFEPNKLFHQTAHDDGGALQQLLRSNIEGVFHTLQLVVPHMVPSEDDQARGWGRIVLVSSTLDDFGLPRTAPYATAKSALRGLALVLKSELGPRGVLVNVVKPGLTTTERVLTRGPPEAVINGETLSTPTRRLTTPADVAKMIVFLSSGANGNATGQVISVDGGRT